MSPDSQVLRTQGRSEEAIPEFEMAIGFDRNWVSAYANLGWCKFLTGSIEEALPLQEQAIRLSPRDPGIGNEYWRIGLAHLLQSRTDEAILWLEKAHSANSELRNLHICLAAAYALKGETERAAAELVEAKSLVSDDRFSSVARLKTSGSFRVSECFRAPKIRALVETTYIAGLRKAGMPEE